MSRPDAQSILASRMTGAPNLDDYLAWLARQPDWVLIALAQGQPVNLRKGTL